MEAAKRDRTKAKRLFTQSITDINKFLEQGVDISLIEIRMTELWRRQDDVQTQHEAVIDFIEDENEQSIEDEYLHKLSVEFNALEIQSIQYIKKVETESINGSTSEKDMEVALQARELEGETFMQIAEIAMTIISKRSSCANPVVSVVWSTIEQLKQQMQKFEVAQRDYITLIGIEKGREEINWTVKY